MSTDDTRKLPEGFDIIIARLDSFEKRMDSFEQNVATRLDSFEQAVTARMDSFEQRLTALEEKADRQVIETRPIWERALAEIAETRAEMGKGFRNVERRLEIVSSDINQMRASLRDLEDRLDKLDHQPS
ncbi:MAG: hypothetical protein L0229_00200 [Blastocatellia bacterium]|nr:hypothetical protein [Blastocatellia bacterium]